MPTHTETWLQLNPNDWKLQHSLSDWQLIEKAATQNAALNDADRSRLVELSGPFWGRALGDPESLTPEEIRTAKGWPAPDVVVTNVARICGESSLTPEAFISKAAAGGEWLTLEQTDLLDQRFNIIERNERRTVYRTEHYDRYRAGWLLATPEERQAYRNAQLRGQLLRRPGNVLNPAYIAQEEAREEASGDEIGSFGDHRDQPLWIKDILYSLSRKYGFPVWYTTELHTYLADSTRDLQVCSPVNLISDILKNKVFSSGGSMKMFAAEERGKRYGGVALFLARSSTFNISGMPVPSHPEDDGATARFLHRMARIGGTMEPNYIEGQSPTSRMDEQYFVVLDHESLPELTDQRIWTLAIMDIVVWLYDADWDPPSSGTDVAVTRDQDGYAGRIKISYGYHLYMGLYPHLLRPEFNLKDVWAIHRSEDYVYRTADFSVLSTALWNIHTEIDQPAALTFEVHL